MPDSQCLDQALNYINIERLEDHFEVKDLTLGHPMNFDVHISFDWLCQGPFPSPFRDVGLHFNHSDHSQWSMHSYSHIIVRPLISASDFAYPYLASDWVGSFDRLKTSLTCISFMYLIWTAPPVLLSFLRGLCPHI